MGALRTSWIFNSETLKANAINFKIAGVRNAQIHQFLGGARKVIYAKKANDPRTERHHTIDLTFQAVGHDFIRMVEEVYQFNAPAFQVKLYLLDYTDIPSVTTLNSEAARLRPSGYPVAGSYTDWYLPYRGISNDGGADAPSIYVNGVLTGSGFTIDYTEGKVTFTVAKASTDVIRAFYVWKPYVTVARFDKNPLAGKTRGFYKYSPNITLEEIDA